MRDPYQILGVERTATEAEIKSAYRKLAKKLHPDVNPGRKDIEQKFKEVTAAYDLLSDAGKRVRYDRGEIDEMGNAKGFNPSGDPFGGMRGRRGGAYSYTQSQGDPFGGFGVDDLFAEFFGKPRTEARNKHRQTNAPPRGEDIVHAINVPFVEACLGGKQRITLPNQKTVEINIPPASDTGDKLRLRGQGMPGKMENGDALIELKVDPHPYFSRQGYDLTLELPISLPEAIMGTTVTVPTLDGFVSVKVPKGANAGTTLRLKGKGVKKVNTAVGDLFIKVKIALPDPPDESLNELIEKWAKKNDYDTRKKLNW